MASAGSDAGQGSMSVRVKLRRTHCEQMSSGLSLKADIAQYSRHVSKVPVPEVNGLVARRVVISRELGRQ